jgi:hypothetical protein
LNCAAEQFGFIATSGDTSGFIERVLRLVTPFLVVDCPADDGLCPQLGEDEGTSIASASARADVRDDAG